ncbi:type III pantothenate kinase [Mucilaginibacter sp. UR6-11]|uniref:type III pantothenate kinase n=1 Tax=Mucilaginibacter sp. UR6-11 TaxID=1435644 RepID=UPI001E482E21|nr:type III pantothenate kinase [Mucilaginibacter sp. UR6-11]MCC8425246.1 type III pantothenate kinase [Mucilaginibacter sp. UR6-11]
MANLVVDIGNTLTKAAIFEQDELVYTEHYTTLNTEILDTFLTRYAVDKAIISSVKKNSEAWESGLKQKVQLIYFNTGMTTGIHNHYRTPQTLGLDRLAAVIGANHLYPDKNNLVIDGGTCITYDWIDAGGNYFGGSISPGLNMRYNALNHYTAGLPVVKQDPDFKSNSGNDTETAIRSGVQNGIKFELNGFIESYVHDEKQLNIILTGGDSIFFDTLLKNSIFAPYIKNEPHLVLKGLNAATQKHND